MSEETAIMLLEHTGYDDFNLLEHQIIGRLNAIKVLINKNKQLKNDNAVMKAGLIQASNKQLDLYKEVIEEVREYVENNDNFELVDLYSQSMADGIQKELLQILDKVKGDKDNE